MKESITYFEAIEKVGRYGGNGTAGAHRSTEEHDLAMTLLRLAGKPSPSGMQDYALLTSKVEGRPNTRI